MTHRTLRVAAMAVALAVAAAAYAPAPSLAAPRAPREMVHAAGVVTGPDDPLVGQQTYLDRVHATTAWAVTHGSASVVVAVLDSGVDPTHPDLAGKLLAPADFVSIRCGTGTDAAQHGTAVAGLVGAATDNEMGIAGLGWDTRVLPLRVLCDDGNGSAADVARAVRYAVAQGARIVNLSLTGSRPDDELAAAVRDAQAHGVLVVAAAGNDATEQPVYPAALPGVVAVTALGPQDTLASFADRGPWVDLAAPGVGLRSTAKSGGFVDLTGTSFAAPLVSATAALVMARFPGISPDGVARRLQAGAQPLATEPAPVRWGALDAGASVAAPFAGLRAVDPAGALRGAGDAGSFVAPLAHPAHRVVGFTPTPTEGGGWVAASDGGVFTLGDAGFFGSAVGLPLAAPMVAMAATPSGRGYWLVGSDGGVFAFGDAGFFGSAVGLPLAAPMVAMAATPSGRGYWLVGSDGGVFAFGDAVFAGAATGRSRSPAVAVAAAGGAGSGYWIAFADGVVLAFGGAPAFGRAPSGVVGVVAVPAGGGYWVIGSDGSISAFGNAPPLGRVTGPVIAAG